jgi:c-di-GMP-binding flagellar brake protein YcgR
MIEPDKKPAVHDQVLVETEVDGRLIGFRAVVVNVSPAALWLGLLRPDARLEKVRPGASVGLTIRRNGAAMIGRTAFLGHLGSSQARLFSIGWPDDYQLVQRREHLRLDTEAEIRYVIVSQSETGSAGMEGQGTTRNLSAGGLQFIVKAQIRDTVSAGDALELHLKLGQDVVLAEADVIRVEDATDMGPDGRPLPPARPLRTPRTLIAVRFEEISDGAQDRIVRHIFSLQRMRRG